MVHGTTSGKLLATFIAVLVLGSPSAEAKEKDPAQAEATRQACIGAFGDRDHFDWLPRMGLQNALDVCRSAIARFADDAEVRLYYAIARDQFAERGGTQQDNLYATDTYRELAAAGVPLAQYALGTMFDEDAGVSTQDALDYLAQSRNGDFGASIRCEALRTFGYADLDGNGAFYDVAAAESMAHGNYVCAAYLVDMYRTGHVNAQDLPLPLADYARYAAVHGDPAAMALVGLFYAYGTGSMDIDALLQGQYSARQDAEKAGYWLLLAHWATKSSMRPDVHQDFWDHDHLLSPTVMSAIQTALAALGFYEGQPSGTNDQATQDGMAAFEASNFDAVFQAVRAKEKYAGDLGPRVPLHIGDAALAPAD
jgi:hypothetical protein